VTDPRPGILLLDKPVGPTSHDLVQRIRRLAGTRRIGHAGTLDPAASGLLVLGIGAATRLLPYLVGLDKTYLATIRLGSATTTDDAEGQPLGAPTAVTEEVLARVPQVLASFTGEQDQVPSAVSAVHVNGRRAHELVRAGEAVELAARRVVIPRLDLLEVRGADLDVVVDCSSGTYIRALARDVGAALGVGGHVTALRRTRVGPLTVAEAAPAEELRLLAPAELARRLFPVVDVGPPEALALRQGKRLPMPGVPDAAPVAAIGPDGSLVGLVAVSDGVATVRMNLPAASVASARDSGSAS
jgi:tRNA pseudouridine55 synthase